MQDSPVFESLRYFALQPNPQTGSYDVVAQHWQSPGESRQTVSWFEVHKDDDLGGYLFEEDAEVRLGLPQLMYR